MFFLIAGVQPKVRTIDNTPQRCPHCGLHQSYRQSVDHYLCIFFVPLIRLRKGADYLYCQRCRQPVDYSPDTAFAGPASCRRCGIHMDADYPFCPHCGQRQ